MWVEKVFKKLPVLILNNEDDILSNVEKARFAPLPAHLSNNLLSNDLGYLIYGDASCVMYPEPVKLSCTIIANPFDYQIALAFYNDEEIEDISQRMLIAYADKINHEKSEIQQLVEKGYSSHADPQRERLTLFLEGRIKAVEYIKKFSEENYTEVTGCQRIKKDNKPWESQNDEPLTPEERQILKPTLVELMSILPELPEQFKPKEYYQSLIANF